MRVMAAHWHESRGPQAGQGWPTSGARGFLHICGADVPAAGRGLPEVWAWLGLTNVLVMLVARRMAGFSQETSDLVQTCVSRTKLADRHYGRPHLLRGMPKVVRCYLSIVLRPAA